MDAHVGCIIPVYNINSRSAQAESEPAGSKKTTKWFVLVLFCGSYIIRAGGIYIKMIKKDTPPQL